MCTRFCTRFWIFLTATVVGGTLFPQKCLEGFTKVFAPSYICINGHSTRIEGVRCRTGELLFINDFVLYTPKVNDGTCPDLDGFNYNQTVKASCLNKENKDLSKQIASALLSSRANIVEAQSSLNNIFQGVHLLIAFAWCYPENVGNFVDICTFSNSKGLVKFYISMFKSQLMSSETRPSSCSCSIRSSSEGISIRPINVRLKATDTLQSYQGRDSIGYDIFEKSDFLWSIDDFKVFHTDYLNITLTTREKWQPWNKLMIELEGSDMTATCGPVCDGLCFCNQRNTSDLRIGHTDNKSAIAPLVSHESSDHSEYIAAMVVLSLVAVGFVISTIVACYMYRKTLREKLIQEARCNYDHLDSLMSDSSAYQLPQATSTGWTSRSGQSSTTQQQEEENVQQYYSTVRAVLNPESDVVP